MVTTHNPRPGFDSPLKRFTGLVNKNSLVDEAEVQRFSKSGLGSCL
jgi:hypothetical protein